MYVHMEYMRMMMPAVACAMPDLHIPHHKEHIHMIHALHCRN
jgi:hypothetical protein